MFSTTDLIFPGFSDATIGKVDPNRKAFRKFVHFEVFNQGL